MEKKYFNVTYRVSEDVWSANLAHAENADDVRAFYERENRVSGGDIIIADADDYAVEDAQRRHKPIVEIDHVEPATVEEKPSKGADFWERVDALKADYEPTPESRELALYAINSGWLYRGTVNRVMDLLARRINRGTYDAGKAVKAFDGAVKEAAVHYIQEFSTPDYTGFKPVNVRRACAAEMLEHYAEEIAERADANKLPKMSVYQIREKMNRAGYAPHFWDHDTLAFFGESIGAMRVLQEPGTMEGRKCYVISSFQRKAPGGGCTAYHYIDAETFEHVGTLHSW